MPQVVEQVGGPEIRPQNHKKKLLFNFQENYLVVWINY
jgi:hypothetical protein